MDHATRVKVKCGSLQAYLAIDDNDETLNNFLPENKEAVRGILLNLALNQSFPENEDWAETLNNWPVTVTIPSLNISYTCGISNTEMQEACTQQLELAHTPQQENRHEPILEVQHEHTQEEISHIYHWGHNAIKFLISKYTENKENFANKGIKKDRLWKSIADSLKENNFGNPTAQQVEDKFKNLRRSYAKIKDAMGPNCSGAPSPGSFKYFDEMDEIFKNNPSFTPALIVSNRRGHEVQMDVDQTPKKRAKPRENLVELAEKRHNNILEELRKTRETLSEKLDKLIDKL